MSKELMLALPEVAHLVERIPAARLVIEADPIQLRFFQHARDSNMSLKEQCRLLGIPWHARRITEATATPEALEAAKVSDPTIFASCFPAEDAEAAKKWCAVTIEMKDAPVPVRRWLARNAVAVFDQWGSVKRYIVSRECVGPAPSLKPETLIERAVAWAAETERAYGLRMRELYGFGGYDARNAMNDAWVRNAYLQQAAQQYNPYQNGLYAPHRDQIEDRSDIAYTPHQLAPVEHGGFTVQLLNTHRQFSDEGKRMHHCVETYFPRAKGGGCFIVSVTDARGKKIATAEFTPDWELIQAKGPTNTNVRDNERLVAALRHFGAQKTQEPVAAVPKPAAEPAEPVQATSSSWTGITRSDDGFFGNLLGDIFGWRTA
jgi:hypothetical protein